MATLLPMMFLGLHKLGNICFGHNFCVPDTKCKSATNVARAGKRGNICVGNNVSATMCPQQCVRNNVSSFARAFRLGTSTTVQEGWMFVV